MNVSGVTSTASMMPMASGADVIQTQMMASVEVLNMAQNAFEDAAAILLEQMAAAITGVGTNVDITV